MPQMSPMLWSSTIIMTINLLLLTSSFMYFFHFPFSYNLYLTHKTIPSTPLNNFNWLWY